MPQAPGGAGQRSCRVAGRKNPLHPRPHVRLHDHAALAALFHGEPGGHGDVHDRHRAHGSGCHPGLDLSFLRDHLVPAAFPADLADLSPSHHPHAGGHGPVFQPPARLGIEAVAHQPVVAAQKRCRDSRRSELVGQLDALDTEADGNSFVDLLQPAHDRLCLNDIPQVFQVLRTWYRQSHGRGAGCDQEGFIPDHVLRAESQLPRRRLE